MKLFSVILIWAAWQDIEKRSLGNGFLLAAACLGLAVSTAGKRDWLQLLASVQPGIFLLLLSWLTAGGIGRGDGWFFVMSGLFLEPWANLGLLVSGILLCGVYGLLLAVLLNVRGESVRRRRLPLLPFLLPAGLWLSLFS